MFALLRVVTGEVLLATIRVLPLSLGQQYLALIHRTCTNKSKSKYD